MKYRKWSKKEDKVLLYQIKRFYTLNDAFIYTAELLDRTVPSCKQRWYSVLSKNPNSAYYMTISPNKTINKKPNTWWNKFINLLKKKTHLKIKHGR